jgi:putative transposase
MSLALATPQTTAFYLSAADLAELPGFPRSERRAREAAARLQLPSRPRAGRGGGLEYAVDALPPQARMAWAARLAASNDAQLPKLPSLAQSRALASGSAVHVTGWQKERQDAVARVLVVFQRFWASFGGPLTPALEAFCLGWSNGQIEADAASKARFPKLTVSTLRAWHLGVQDRGLAAITPREHHRKGQFAALSGKLGDAVLALILERPHISVTAIYNTVSNHFKGKSEIPSERAFRRAITYWKTHNAQLLTGITNPDAWRNQYMSAAGSASEGITRPNQLWEMDSTPGDVLLADGKRHAVVGMIDVYTRRRLFLVSRTSRSGAVMSLIRRAIALFGRPEAIKTDNGQDYVADQLEFALLGLGIEHPLCTPFSPQQKPHIERAIGALMHEHFELLDGYIGHNVADRKDIEARRAFSERLFDAEEGLELRLTPEQLQESIDIYCERRLHKPMSSLGERTPAQMALGFAPTTVAERALDVLLANSAFKAAPTIGKKGIRIGGGHYNHALLGGMEGQQVQVKVDDADLGRAWVFDLDGQYICEALDYERLGINQAEVAAQRKAHQALLMKEGKRQLKLATREFDTRAAIGAITRERTQAAIEASSNVVSLHQAAPAVQATNITLDSIAAAGRPAVDTEQLEAAQAALQASVLASQAQPSALVLQLNEMPQQRYARWLGLQERVSQGQALSGDESHWLTSYAQSAEHAQMKSYFEIFGMAAADVQTG